MSISLEKIKNFIDQLESQNYKTEDDLTVIVNNGIFDKISASWPAGLKNRIKQKLGSTAQAQSFVHKECWIFHQADYSKLRKLKGCEKLVDLPTTKEDSKDARKIAMGMGIKEKDIHMWTGDGGKGMTAREIADFINKRNLEFQYL